MRIKLATINPSMLALIAEGFLSRLSFGLISFALPLYAHRLGLSLTEIGVLVALNLAVTILLKPATGWAADRLGLKLTLTAAIALRSIVSLLLAFARLPWHLYGIRTLHGLSMAVRDPSVNALIAEYGGKKTVASSFAWYQTAKSLAGAVGKTTAGILLAVTASNFSLVFAVAFFLSALPLVIVVSYVREGRLETADGHTPSLTKIQVEDPHASIDRTPPRLLPFAGLGFLVTGAAQMLHGLFPLLATQYAGLDEAQTGLIYLASTLVILFSGPLFGWMSDNVSRNLVLMVRGAANSLSSVVYLIAPSFPGFVLGRVVDDLGKSAFRPAWGALMAHISSFDRRRRAQTMGALTMGEDAGEIAGPILAGFLWSTWGTPVLLGARVVLAVAAEIYTLILMRLTERPPALLQQRPGARAHRARYVLVENRRERVRPTDARH